MWYRFDNQNLHAVCSRVLLLKIVMRLDDLVYAQVLLDSNSF